MQTPRNKVIDNVFLETGADFLVKFSGVMTCIFANADSSYLPQYFVCFSEIRAAHACQSYNPLSKLHKLFPQKCAQSFY